jgi:NADP-dependent 3-hydroxy acid dehydrogenase YdfG/acyl carrier protein
MHRGELQPGESPGASVCVAQLTSLAHVARALAAKRVATPAIWLVTEGAMRVEDRNEPVNPTQAMSWGFVRTVALEHPEIWGGAVDVSHDVAASAVARELSLGGPEDQVALRGHDRYVARLARRTVADARSVTLSSTGTYLVTGGVGALGMHTARWLVDRGARHLVLTSRRGATDDGSRAGIRALTERGARVSVVAADVSVASDVDRVLRGIPATAPLRGIVHAAGVDHVASLNEVTQPQIEEIIAAKVHGAALLHDRTRTLDLDLFVCYSSVAAVLGSQGRAYYSAANAFLDGLVDERRRLGLCGVSVSWGPWKGGGMATAQSLEQFERVGNRGLDPDDAIRTLDRLVANDVAHAAVMDVDWPTFAPIYESRRSRPLIQDVVTGEAAQPQAVVTGAAAPWIARLSAVPAAERSAALVTLLRAEVADTLGFDDASNVPVDRNFYELGMDSLMMADLVGRLKSRTGVSCSASAFNHPQVAALAGALIGTLPIDSVSHGASSAAPDAVDSHSPQAVHATQGPGALPEDEILAFQFEAFPARRRDWVVPRWRWMFVRSAQRIGVEPKFWIHREAGRIAGQMGSIPVRLQIGGEERDARWLVDTMVLEQYRSQALGPRLMVVAHEDEPFSLSLGQTVEMREIQFRLGWKQVAPMQVAQLLVRPDAVLKGKLPRPAVWAAGLGVRASSAVREWLSEPAAFEARTIDRFDTRHDELWRSVARQFPCAVVRDASYLNWKYVEQPGQCFVRVDVTEGDRLRGTAVWMIRDADRHYKYRRAFLVDLVTSMSDPAALRQTVKAACKVAIDLEVDSLLCHHIQARLTRALRACGFRLRQPQRFLLVDPGPLDGSTLERVLSAESWYVTHGDSDIDRPW